MNFLHYTAIGLLPFLNSIKHERQCKIGCPEIRNSNKISVQPSRNLGKGDSDERFYRRELQFSCVSEILLSFSQQTIFDVHLSDFRAESPCESQNPSTKREPVEDDPSLLRAQGELYALIARYQRENVSSMDEVGLFFGKLPKYTRLLPSENTSTTRDGKLSNAESRFLRVRMPRDPRGLRVRMIGKAKSLADIARQPSPIPYYHQNKAWFALATCWNAIMTLRYYISDA